MSRRGFFVVDRSLFDHHFFKSEAFTEREAWLWLIGAAAWEATKVRVNRKEFAVTRGQLVHAIRFLAAKWQWSEPRVRRFLERLKREAMIDALAFADATLITVCKYDDYQFGRRTRDALSDEPATNSRRREEETQQAKEDLGRDARAREPAFKISAEAFAFADELALLCGQSLDCLTPQWMSAQPAMRVQMMLDAGWRIDVMREAATAAVRKKRDGPPENIRYFEKPFARAHAPPLPLPVAQVVHSSEVPHEKSQSGWQGSRDNWRRSLATLKANVAGTVGAAGNGETGGGQIVRIPAATGRRGR